MRRQDSVKIVSLCVCALSAERGWMFTGVSHFVILHHVWVTLRQWCVSDNLWHCDGSGPKYFNVCVCISEWVWSILATTVFFLAYWFQVLGRSLYLFSLVLKYFLIYNFIAVFLWKSANPIFVTAHCKSFIWQEFGRTWKRASVKSVLIFFKGAAVQ